MSTFDHDAWVDRFANRTDITSMLTHLTKPTEGTLKSMDEDDINLGAVDTLIKILQDKKIYGSTSHTGFIVGKKRAVCFQEAPLYGLIQNVEYERKKRIENKSNKIRYCGIGLVFSKRYVYSNGGRPVFYEQTNLAKVILPEDEHWRIVNLQIDLSNLNMVDWTHEREWRLPGEFNFEPKWTHVLLYDKKCWDYFYKHCPREIYDSIYGITILKSMLM